MIENFSTSEDQQENFKSIKTNFRKTDGTGLSVAGIGTTSTLKNNSSTQNISENESSDKTDDDIQDKVDITTTPSTEMTPTDKLKLKYNKLTIKNKELNLSNEKLEDKIEKQKMDFYIASNYNKINEKSLQNLPMISRQFNSSGYPQVDLDDFTIIKNKQNLDKVVQKAKTFKNIYKPGDIVSDNSSFNITKDNICYRNNGKPMKVTREFKDKYPECMVCTTIPAEKLKDSESWKDTKTNIEKVCLFNPKSKDNSGIANLKECKKMCSI